MMADKMDINEEVTRLLSHLKFFMQALESDVPVGRRLNFLSQEINRELNTIGSKCNDSEISQHIVLGKENLEQIREQVQNIEQRKGKSSDIGRNTRLRKIYGGRAT